MYNKFNIQINSKLYVLNLALTNLLVSILQTSTKESKQLKYLK